MKPLLITICLLALGVTAVLPVLFLVGVLALPALKWALLGATVVWLTLAPFWLGSGEKSQ